MTIKNKKLWCVSFMNFKFIAEKNKWTEHVPDDIAIISIVNQNDSINDMGTEFRHLCEGPNVLNLDFDDADPVGLGISEDSEEYTMTDGTLIKFFTSEMADRTVRFIEEHKDRNFYIHCAAGMSRSQAFVKYIMNVYYEDNWETNPDNPCLFANGFVYSKLMRSYREQEIF